MAWSRGPSGAQPRAAAQFEAVLSRGGGYFRSFFDVTGRSGRVSIFSREINVNGPRCADLEAKMNQPSLDFELDPGFCRSKRRPKGLSAACLRSKASRARVGPTDEAKKTSPRAPRGDQGRDCACKRAHEVKPVLKRRHRRAGATRETDH